MKFKYIFIIILFSNIINAKASVFLEPYLGYLMRNHISNISSQEIRYESKGYTYGVKAGFELPIGLIIGADASYASLSGNQKINDIENVTSKSANAAKLGVLLGFSLPFRIGIYAGFDYYNNLVFTEDFSSGNNYKKDDFVKGINSKVGVSYLALSFIKVNFEYHYSTTNEIKRFGNSYETIPDWYSDKDYSINLTISFPYYLFGSPTSDTF
jgi:hypothetical protein